MVDHLSLYAFLDICEQFTSTIRYHSKEFSTSQSIISNSDTAVPDADDDHDITDVHLLEHCQQLVTRAILTIVVETLCQNLFLLNRINLADSVG